MSIVADGGHDLLEAARCRFSPSTAQKLKSESTLIHTTAHTVHGEDKSALNQPDLSKETLVFVAVRHHDGHDPLAFRWKGGMIAIHLRIHLQKHHNH